METIINYLTNLYNYSPVVLALAIVFWALVVCFTGAVLKLFYLLIFKGKRLRSFFYKW